jgi:hypothetical protein
MRGAVSPVRVDGVFLESKSKRYQLPCRQPSYRWLVRWKFLALFIFYQPLPLFASSSVALALPLLLRKYSDGDCASYLLTRITIEEVRTFGLRSVLRHYTTDVAGVVLNLALASSFDYLYIYVRLAFCVFGISLSLFRCFLVSVSVLRIRIVDLPSASLANLHMYPHRIGRIQVPYTLYILATSLT